MIENKRFCVDSFRETAYRKQAAKQAALQKTLSAAYLNHQISELESRVQQQSLFTTNDRPSLGEQDVPSGLDADRDVAQRGMLNGGRIGDNLQHHDHLRKEGVTRYEKDNWGRIDDDEDESDSFNKEEEDVVRQKEEYWRVVVIDASALMWALKSVRRLVAKGYEVIVPLDCIRTLDLMKKGMSASAVAARSAARYIEHATRQHKHISADPSLTIQLGTNYKKGRGLRIQREGETANPQTLSPLPLPPDAPLEKWIAAVMGCVAYFNDIDRVELASAVNRHGDSAEAVRPMLYVANPPLAVEAAELDMEVEIKYVERGEGYALSQEAERFEVVLEVLRDTESEEGFHTRGRGRGRWHGRGRGRGGYDGERGRGRGHGRTQSGGHRGRKEDVEPAKEYKILRRPASDDAPANPRAPTTVSASQGSPHGSSPQLPTGLEIEAATSPVIHATPDPSRTPDFLPISPVPPPRAQPERLDKEPKESGKPSSELDTEERRGNRRGGRRGGRTRGRGKDKKDGRRSPQFELLQRPEGATRPPPPPPNHRPLTPPGPRILARPTGLSPRLPSSPFGPSHRPPPVFSHPPPPPSREVMHQPDMGHSGHLHRGHAHTNGHHSRPRPPPAFPTWVERPWGGQLHRKPYEHLDEPPTESKVVLLQRPK
ncbi:hypothetical protein TREMEDRAFT_74767 [Tremella mesenterica DSM 1558]|uniref:uncharacterized protein n=1 Tax=Tremella mesenterica (strain ATCC 24925 / CBS 8224 / DSM 1558 / NBRC 9311 / NRRL Y-6157 / RJB 2259-6 / UBC 559-6) TaxID=578456 RepID=UPI00032C0B7A|nr:uncharacterized protein TREMEDRAFT_74767 [Tremella mesenterica DSM 1558]EIW66636.1 hypothetical protein TREMEDRAFT_74767 [Tremella mesenterica DSM 1558]